MIHPRPTDNEHQSRATRARLNHFGPLKSIEDVTRVFTDETATADARYESA
jgi:hypothetical protein